MFDLYSFSSPASYKHYFIFFNYFVGKVDMSTWRCQTAIGANIVSCRLAVLQQFRFDPEAYYNILREHISPINTPKLEVIVLHRRKYITWHILCCSQQCYHIVLTRTMCVGQVDKLVKTTRISLVFLIRIYHLGLRVRKWHVSTLA